MSPSEAKRVEYFFDFGSPTSYLAWTQLPAIAPAAGAAIDWRPMLLGGVFKATGNASPVSVPAKGRWMSADLSAWPRATACRSAQPALPDQHADADARRDRPAAAPAGRVRALPRGRQRAMWESRRTSAIRRCSPRRSAPPASTPTRSPRSSAIRRSRRGSCRPPRKRSPAACSARRPSSSAKRCSSARTGSTSCARPFSRA